MRFTCAANCNRSNLASRAQCHSKIYASAQCQIFAPIFPDFANSSQSRLFPCSARGHVDLPSRASSRRAYASSGLKESVSFFARCAKQIVVNFFGTRLSLFSTVSNWIVCAVSRTTSPRRPM